MADWKNVHLAEQDEKIADLTRRLAEAEECLTIAHMDGYHKGQKAGQSEHNNSVRMGQYILEAKTEKRLREAAEARVRELEALKTNREGTVEKLQGLLLQAELRANRAEAERDALRERCETLGHELGTSKQNEARWIKKGEEAISERTAANKALEAIKKHQEIVAGTGTAQMSTTWKIADDHLRSRGAALAATEVQ